MKHPLKLMSLPLENEHPLEDLSLDELCERFKLPWQDRVTLVAYIDNTGRIPQNFEPGTEAYDQWCYTGRKKKDKATLQQSLQNIEE